MQFPLSIAAVGLALTASGMLLSIIIMIASVSIYFGYRKFRRAETARIISRRQRLHDGQVSLILHALRTARTQHASYLEGEDRAGAVQQVTEIIADIEALESLLTQADDVELQFDSPPTMTIAIHAPRA